MQVIVWFLWRGMLAGRVRETKLKESSPRHAQWANSSQNSPPAFLFHTGRVQWRLNRKGVAGEDGEGMERGEEKHVISSWKWRGAWDSQLSNCMMHVCTSMGKFFRSMGQARVSVILRREDNKGQWCTVCGTDEGMNPLDAKCCIQAGNLSGVMEGMTDYSLLSCLCFHTCCWKASEMPRIWVCEIIPGRDWWNGRCCFTVILSWTVQKSVLPHQSFAASAFISCLRLTTVWISSEPKPVLWTQHTFLATDAVWKSLNRTFLYQNKPRTLVKTADFCGRNERCECKFLQGKCPLQLTVTVPFWIPTVPLESSSFTFPLGAGCISHGKLWCCAVLQSTFKMFAYFNKLLWNDVDVIHINTSWTCVIWFDNMPFPRFRFRLILIFRCINAFQTFRFFSYLPRCRNSRVFGR